MVQTPGLLNARKPKTSMSPDAIDRVQKITRTELSNRRRIRWLATMSLYDSVVIVTDEQDVRNLIEKFMTKR